MTILKNLTPGIDYKITEDLSLNPQYCWQRNSCQVRTGGGHLAAGRSSNNTATPCPSQLSCPKTSPVCALWCEAECLQEGVRTATEISEAQMLTAQSCLQSCACLLSSTVHSDLFSFSQEADVTVVKYGALSMFAACPAGEEQSMGWASRCGVRLARGC